MMMVELIMRVVKNMPSNIPVICEKLEELFLARSKPIYSLKFFKIVK